MQQSNNSTANTPFLEISHGAMPKMVEQQNDQRVQERDSSSPPGNLSLSQLSGLPGMSSSISSADQTSMSRAWANQHGNDHSPLTFLENDHHDQYGGNQNSLGLLGGEFPNATNSTSNTPPLQQHSIDQAAHHNGQNIQQQFSLHHHHHSSSSSSSFPSPFNSASMSIGHPMQNNQPNWQQIMGNGMNFDHANNAGGTTLHRQHSISNLSDASSSSLYNDGASLGSQSAFDPTSPIRSSFTPSQSPMGMTHSLSSLAGLAIGTPQQQIMNPSALEEYVAGPGSQFAHHENLLSLSGTQPNPPFTGHQHHQSLMAPPLSTSVNSRRRSTGVAHSLYTDQVRQLRQNMGGILPNDDITPMPPSHQMFSGQPSDSDVSSLAASSTANSAGNVKDESSEESEESKAARMPTTPRNSRTLANSNVYSRTNQPATMPPNMTSYTTFQTPQSMPSQCSPDDSSILGSSISGSAFSAPRLTRMDSFDSFTTGSAYSSPSSESRGSIGMQGKGTTGGGRSLEATIAEHEAKLEAAQMQNYHHSNNEAVGDRTLSPSSVSTMSGNNTSAAMSRVSSAPATALQQGMMMNGGGYTSIPSTPSRSSLGLHGQVQESPLLPVTPMGPNNMAATAAALNAAGLNGYSNSSMQQAAMNQRNPNTAAYIAHHHHRMHELTMSAPQMMASRSTSSLPSPMGGMEMGMGMGMGMELMSPTSSVDMQRHQQAAAIAAASMQNNPFGSPEGGDDMIRSPSSGAARNATPRSRGRNAAPPPLIVSSADKLHVCYCGKRFKRLEHLKRHNRVHTQERPHPCPAPGCNKWFGRTDNLTQHLKTHYRTLGRTSESLLQITQAAAVAKANGPEARGLNPAVGGGMGMSLDGLNGAGLQNNNGGEPQEARHDPHAAAAAAAAQAVSKTNMKRRTTISNDMLGGPISLSSPNSSSNGSNPGLGKRGSDTLLPQHQQQQFYQNQEMEQELKPSVSPQPPSISPMQV